VRESGVGVAVGVRYALGFLMTTFLALVSITAAAVCAGLLWRVISENRRRSEARIAALASAIDGPRLASAAAEPIATASLFEAGRPSPMQGRPLLKVAIGFAMAVTIIVLAAMTGDRQATRPVRGAADEVGAVPLELLSMRHARSGDQLTVTGLVRNPGTAVPARIIAVVLAFDRRGDFVASGRAPLEFPTLASGDESPFQVTIPKLPDVGRYRISFRTESGAIRHIDRREGGGSRVASN
jgi:hypothetical protein